MLSLFQLPAMGSGERNPSNKEEIKLDSNMKEKNAEKTSRAPETIEKSIFATAKDIEYLSKMQDKGVPKEEIDAWTDTLFTAFSEKHNEEIGGDFYHKMQTIIWNKAKTHNFSPSTVTLVNKERYENNVGQKFYPGMFSLDVVEERVKEYKTMQAKRGSDFLSEMGENHRDYGYFLESHEMEMWLNERNKLLKPCEKSEGDVKKEPGKKDKGEKLIQKAMRKAADDYENAQVAYIEGKGKEPVEEERYFTMMDSFLRGQGKKPELFLKGKAKKEETLPVKKNPPEIRSDDSD